MPTVISLINAKSRTVVTASNKFADALKPGVRYRIYSSVDCWYKFGDDDDTVAASGDGAVQLAGGADHHYDSPRDGKVYLHVIRAAGVDGDATVAEVVETEV